MDRYDFSKEAEELETAILALTTAMLGRSARSGDANIEIICAALRAAYERGVNDAAKVADDLAEENRRAEIHYARGGNDFAEVEAIAARKECEAVAAAIRALKDKQP